MVPSVLLNDWLLSVCLSTLHHTALFRVGWDDDGITLNADIEYALWSSCVLFVEEIESQIVITVDIYLYLLTWWSSSSSSSSDDHPLNSGRRPSQVEVVIDTQGETTKQQPSQ